MTPRMSSTTSSTWRLQECVLDHLHVKQTEGSLVLFQEPLDLWTVTVKEMSGFLLYNKLKHLTWLSMFQEFLGLVLDFYQQLTNHSHESFFDVVVLFVGWPDVPKNSGQFRLQTSVLNPVLIVPKIRLNYSCNYNLMKHSNLIVVNHFFGVTVHPLCFPTEQRLLFIFLLHKSAAKSATARAAYDFVYFSKKLRREIEPSTECWIYE